MIKIKKDVRDFEIIGKEILQIGFSQSDNKIEFI
jgi:hypothetical protein